LGAGDPEAAAADYEQLALKSAELVKDLLHHDFGQLKGHAGLLLSWKAIGERPRESIRIPNWYVVVVENRQVLREV